MPSIGLLVFFKTRHFHRPIRNNKAASTADNKSSYLRNSKKPEWVVEKVIYLKTIMPNQGWGKIPATFNRLYFDNGESVAKLLPMKSLNQTNIKLP